MDKFAKVRCRTRYNSWTVFEIFEGIKNNDIVIDPPFQRQPVWTNQRKANLIQSIVLGYPVPCIMLVETFKNHKKQYICIDGKQRCISICDFLEDKVSVKLDKLLKYSQFSTQEQGTFKNITVSLAIIENLNEDEYCKVFERINRSVALSNGELAETYMTSPVVKCRNILFNHDNEFNQKLENIFGIQKSMDKRKNNAINMLAIVCGLAFGSKYITTSFPKIQYVLEIDDDEWNSIHRPIFEKNLRIFVTLWDTISRTVRLPQNWIKNNRIWKVSFIIGYQIHSIHMLNKNLYNTHHLNKELLVSIWTKFINNASQDDNLYSTFDEFLSCPNRNIDTKRLKRGWHNIVKYYYEDKFDRFKQIEDDSYDTE
jgi:hypothetical protein